MPYNIHSDSVEGNGCKEPVKLLPATENKLRVGGRAGTVPVNLFAPKYKLRKFDGKLSGIEPVNRLLVKPLQNKK